MNRNQQTTLLNLTTILLLAAVPGTGYLLMTDQPPVSARQRDRSSYDLPTIPKSIDTDWNGLATNYFFQSPMAPKPKEAKPTAAQPVVNVPPPRFQVTAMVVSSQPEQSLITIKDQNRTIVLRIGDQHENYQFDSIDTDGNAVFSSRGQNFPMKVAER